MRIGATPSLLLLVHIIVECQGASNTTTMSHRYDEEIIALSSEQEAAISLNSTSRLSPDELLLPVNHNVSAQHNSTDDELPVPIIARLSFGVARDPVRTNGAAKTSQLREDNTRRFRLMFVALGSVGGMALLVAAALICVVSQRRRRRRPPTDDRHDLVLDTDVDTVKRDETTRYTVVSEGDPYAEKGSYDLALGGYFGDSWCKNMQRLRSLNDAVSEVNIPSNVSVSATGGMRVCLHPDEQFRVADDEVQLSAFVDLGCSSVGDKDCCQLRDEVTVKLAHRAACANNAWTIGVRYRDPLTRQWSLATGTENPAFRVQHDETHVYVCTYQVTAFVCVGRANNTPATRPLKLFAMTFASYNANRTGVDFRVYVSDNLANAHERMRQERERGGTCVSGNEPLTGTCDVNYHVTLTSAQDAAWPWRLPSAADATQVLSSDKYYTECGASQFVEFHCESKEDDDLPCSSDVATSFVITQPSAPNRTLVQITTRGLAKNKLDDS